MTLNTVRLQSLADLTSRPRETIRNAIKLGAAPWDEAQFADTGQRRFTGFHALALVLAEGLMAQKVTMELAGEFVRAHEGAINLFLDEVTNGETITPRFVLALQRAVEDSWTGAGWEPVILFGTGTESEILSTIASELKRVGAVRENRGGVSERRVISGPWSATVSIPEAYRLLRIRAEAAGYLVDGRRIFKIAAEDEAEAE